MGYLFVYGVSLRHAYRLFYSLLFFLFFTLVVFTPFVWIYTKVGKMTEKKRYRLHQLIYFASRFVMIHHGIPGTKFLSKVAEGVDFNKPRIIICNHQSHLDLMCQLVFTPKIIFLTKAWVWNNPFYGSLIRNAEYLPVKEGIESIMPHLRSLIDRGYSIAVYPEGTRSKDCKIGRFHQGAFYIAKEFGLEILPMYLYGSGKILPKTGYHLHKGTFFIEVDKPLTQKELSAMGDLKQQASTMRQHYKEKYEEIVNKMEQMTKQKKVIIIGSGLGGLSTGAILAKNGYDVSVLEQNNQAGGCLQCFTRRGAKFETGMHFIGSAAPGQTLYKLMRYLEIDKEVTLSQLNTDGYDVVVLEGKRYEFANGRAAFIEKMSGYFPDQKAYLEKYCDLIEEIANASSLHSLKYAESDTALNMEYQLRSISDVIDEVITDPVLAEVLVGNLPLYAAEKDKTPFSTHAFIMDFYNQSSYRIKGGE